MVQAGDSLNLEYPSEAGPSLGYSHFDAMSTKGAANMDTFDIQPYLEEFKADLEKCESPIERMMCSSLHSSRLSVDVIHDIHLQQKISHNGRDYRADFVVESQNIYSGKSLFLVVECDGHEFHEKTREQALRDKRRDRDIQAAGYPVMRFTGSEIFKDSKKCVGEVENFFRTNRIKTA